MRNNVLPSPIFTLKCENYVPNCMKFNLDDHILYAGTQSGEILIWNLESNRLKNVQKAGSMCINTLELLIKLNQLISHNKTGEIKCWRINGFELELQQTLSTHIIGFCTLSLYKSNMFLSKGEKSTMNSYSIETFDKISVFDPQQNDSLGDLMVIKSIEDYVFCGYEANIVIMWKEHHIVSQYHFPELECLMTLDVDNNITKGVCGGSSNIIYTFCITDDTISLDKSTQITNSGINVLRLRPDDKILAAACWDLTVRLFSWKSMKLLAVLDSHSTGVLNIVYSEFSVNFWNSNKYMLAVANKDNKITLWDIFNEKDNRKHNKFTNRTNFTI